MSYPDIFRMLGMVQGCLGRVFKEKSQFPAEIDFDIVTAVSPLCRKRPNWALVTSSSGG